MKKIISLCLLVLSASALQGCVTYVYGHGGFGDGWHRGGWDRGYRASANPAGDLVDSSATSATPAALLANDYGVSLDAASKIINFAAGTNMTQSLEDLNLTAEEASAIAELNMPSDATIAKVATKLGEDSTNVKKILADFVQDANEDNQ